MPYVMGASAFWHMPKCGGTFLLQYMQRENLGVIDVGTGHDPAWYSDRLGLSDKRHIGVIRDPWSWYASLFRHAKNEASEQIRTWFRSHAPDMTFGTWLKSVLSRGIYPPIGIWETDPSCPLPDGTVGLWSWLVRYMYQDPSTGRWLVRDLLDTGRMYEAVESVFGNAVDRQKHRVVNHGACRENRAIPPQTTDYRSWYTPDMLSWIATADATLIKTFGFQPFTPSPQAVYRLKEA